jgi:hypothetical protein
LPLAPEDPGLGSEKIGGINSGAAVRVDAKAVAGEAYGLTNIAIRINAMITSEQLPMRMYRRWSPV